MAELIRYGYDVILQKNIAKKGGYLFAVPNSSLQGAGDQRVKFLDTPFKSNEW